MTTEELDNFIEKVLESPFDSAKTKIINFAREMCYKQKEICAQNAECTNNFFEVNSFSITNSPYPDELQ